MPKTSYLPPIPSEPNRRAQSDPLARQREWERHVDARCIGRGSQMTGEQRGQLARNELILLGEYRVPVW